MSLNRSHEGWQVLCFWLLIALTAACFWPAVTGPFVFDDFPNLQNLAQLQGHVDRASIGLYLASFPGNPGRPLAALSFLIEDAAWPAFPEAFKRDNILFHLLTGCLILLLARALALWRTDAKSATWAALIATAMWWLHPMQLSATMLVVQRMTVLSALFVMLGLLLYVGALSWRRLPEFWRVVAAGSSLSACALLAFLCKENGILAFAYASVLCLTLLRPRLEDMQSRYRNLLIWGTAAPTLAICALAFAYLPGIAGNYGARDFTLGERLLTQSRVLMDYAATIALPRSGGQGVFHDDYVVSRSLLDPPSTAVALAAIVTLLGSAWCVRQRFPLYAFAVFWFFAGHLMESTVVPLELYFEHRNYLPMLGPLLAIALVAVGSARRSRIAATVILSVWLCTAALSTRFNAGIWGDAGKLSTIWAAQSPHSVRAMQMLAAYFADHGDLARARAVLDKGARNIRGKGGLAIQRILIDCIDRGITPRQWSQVMLAAGVPSYDRALPDLAAGFSRQALSSGCHGTLSANDARTLLRTLLANPDYTRGEDQGFLYYELARFDLADRNLDALMRHMDLANQHRPNPMVAREQAIHLLTAGLPSPALEYLDRSERMPTPVFKRWLLNMPSRNQPLRHSANQMLAAQAQLPLESPIWP